MSRTIINAGPIIAYYNKGDDWHERITVFLSRFKGQFVTTEAVITEALCLLAARKDVQNELLTDLSKGLYAVEPLSTADFARVCQLNKQYESVPADYADLSLIVVSERLKISDIVSLDSDFDFYKDFDTNLLTDFSLHSFLVCPAAVDVMSLPLARAFPSCRERVASSHCALTCSNIGFFVAN